MAVMNFGPIDYSDDEVFFSEKEYTLKKSITLKVPASSLRCSFEMRKEDASMGSVYAKFYKNGVAISSQYSVSALSADWYSFSGVFSDFSAGDRIQIYTNTGGRDGYLRNFRVAYELGCPAIVGGVVAGGPSWRAPDGFVDGSGTWSDEEKAYDGNTGTFAYVPQNINMWTQWCRFTFSVPVTDASLFRVWWSKAAGATPNSVHIKAYSGLGGEEQLVYSLIDQDKYVEVAVTLTPIAYIDVRFSGLTVVTNNIQLNELALYGK